MQNQDNNRGWATQHIWSIVLLVGLVVASSIGVKMWKAQHPGSMSVIEAQAMDMNAMKPPVGAVPVATEVVGRSSFSAKVTYTGSVAPYTEQTIYPRVEGWVKNLTVYDGDHVQAGKLLAVIESPDLQTRVAEAAGGHAAATSDIAVARSGVARMAAERAAAQDEIETAKSEVAAANARLDVAQKVVTQVQSDLTASKANQEYWKAELNREENLLKAGAISKQEYQSEKAQAAVAGAEVNNKQAILDQAKAGVQAAQAEVASKKSMIAVAGRRATAAGAALAGSHGEVAQKTAIAGQAAAAQSTAMTIAGYRYITAPFSGMVTKRYVSSGQLVNTSTPVLDIVQIDKVRLQANVADKDIDKIRVGVAVTARVSNDPSLVYHATVSSVSPSADRSSRTTIVEAIVDNSNHKLVPGAFFTMEIATSAPSDQITVPSSSIVHMNDRDAVWVVRSDADKGKISYYCTMHPDIVSNKPGTCPKCAMKLEPKSSGGNRKAHLEYVTLGLDSGDRTEVLSGLCDGEEVIYLGQTYLKEGDIVSPTKWGKEGPQELPKATGMGEMQEMPGMGQSNTNAPRDMSNMPGMDQPGAKGKTDNSMPGMKR